MNKSHHTDCPIARVAVLLSDPWTMLIVRDLLKGKMRFSDLERSLSGISSRTLTNKIKHLEGEDIVCKKELHYSLTKKGLKLNKVINAMSEYGKNTNLTRK